jgi:hypothetical protein
MLLNAIFDKVGKAELIRGQHTQPFNITGGSDCQIAARVRLCRTNTHMTDTPRSAKWRTARQARNYIYISSQQVAPHL